MTEKVLFKNRKINRPASFDEYRGSGGYEALAEAIRRRKPQEICSLVKESGLRGRGGAGFPAGVKWSGMPETAPHPRYVVSNTDEMEPGTFKDRVLINVDPHQVIEGIILAGFAVGAQKSILFIRPSYEMEAEMLEQELGIARQAGFLGNNIRGSDFSFDIQLHRSAGRYICGEATAQINAIQGSRAHPMKGGPRMTESGLWQKPTLVNNIETLACVPHILRRGPQWFKQLAATAQGAGTKLYCVSGKVNSPGCYEFPIGTRLSEIIETEAGGMTAGSVLKAFQPGGASTELLPASYYSLEMDFEPLKAIGHRLGTGAVIIYDQNTCLVGATLNLIEFFSRESCGWCTPCREGLPYIRDLLQRLENGGGREEHIAMLQRMCAHMQHAYCAFAPGAVAPLQGLLQYFEDDVREHIALGGCPCSENKKRTAFSRECGVCIVEA